MSLLPGYLLCIVCTAYNDGSSTFLFRNVNFVVHVYIRILVLYMWRMLYCYTLVLILVYLLFSEEFPFHNCRINKDLNCIRSIIEFRYEWGCVTFNWKLQKWFQRQRQHWKRNIYLENILSFPKYLAQSTNVFLSLQ